MKKFSLNFYCFVPALTILGGSYLLSPLIAIKWTYIFTLTAAFTAVQITVCKKNPKNLIVNTLWLEIMAAFAVIVRAAPETPGIKAITENTALCLTASYIFLILLPTLFPKSFRPIFPSLLSKQ